MEIVHAISGVRFNVLKNSFEELGLRYDTFKDYCNDIDPRILGFLKNGAILFGGITRRYFAGIPPIKTDIDLILPEIIPIRSDLTRFGFTSIQRIDRGSATPGGENYAIFRNRYNVFECQSNVAYSLSGNLRRGLPVHLLIPKYNNSHICSTVDFDVNGIMVGHDSCCGFYCEFPATSLVSAHNKMAITYHSPRIFRGQKLLNEGFTLLPPQK